MHEDYDREHVTPFLKNSNSITKINFESPVDYSHLRWTVDEKVDLDAIAEILELFNNSYTFAGDVVDHPDYQQLAKKNMHIMRNEGSAMSNGQKLWKRAKDVIRGATCYSLSVLKCFFQSNGLAIFPRRVVVLYGI